MDKDEYLTLKLIAWWTSYPRSTVGSDAAGAAEVALAARQREKRSLTRNMLAVVSFKITNRLKRQALAIGRETREGKQATQINGAAWEVPRWFPHYLLHGQAIDQPRQTLVVRSREAARDELVAMSFRDRRICRVARVAGSNAQV
jgi:hypothetical protein